MDAVLRSAALYLFLLLIFRLAGKRTLAQITTFDLVLLLIISEVTQQAMVGNDFSLTQAMLAIITLVGLDTGFSLWKQRSSTLNRLIDSVPVLILENGQPLKERMKQLRVDESDILNAARELQGLERLDQIKYAILERSGNISVIPKSGAGG
ncbi:MAG: YetF domain-containing protein [Deinococcota bacterium]